MPRYEVLSGDALNGLLIRLTAGQASGLEGPPVPLPGEDVLRRVDVTRTYAPSGRLLLKDGGQIGWPDSLRGREFAGEIADPRRVATFDRDDLSRWCQRPLRQIRRLPVVGCDAEVLE